MIDIMPQPPLAGIKVVDLTHVIAGPFASQMLGDLGAEIVKIEEPRKGDAGRHLGPFHNDQSHYFLCFNRNKRSIAIDLKTKKGKEIALALIAEADVLVENFAAGALQKLGLDYEAVASANPRLIYCSITGFGHTGPLRAKRYYDLIGQAYAGVMSTNGEADGAPLKVGIPIGDTTGSLFATVAILAALYRRRDTGKGEFVDLSLYDCLLASLANYGGYYLSTGEQPARVGSKHYYAVPYGTYATADGHVVVGTMTDEQWQTLRTALELGQWSAEEGLSDRAIRHERREYVDARLGEELARRSTADVAARLDRAGLPSSPVNTLAAALEDPHAAAREMVRTLSHPTYGDFRTVASPLGRRLTAADNLPPPLLGEHTGEVLGELGFSAAAIDELLRAGVVASANNTMKTE